MAKKRRVSLAAFLRKLWSTRKLLERFEESREGRREVIARFNLSARHARLLLEGCVRDIVVELAGGRLTQSTNVVINCEGGDEDVTCGHPECKNFMKAAVLTMPTPKRKKKR